MSASQSTRGGVIRRASRPVILCVVLVVGALAASGCPSLSLDASNDALDALLERLPAPDVGVKSVLPAGFGLQNSLFGFLMEDDTQAFVVGASDASGNLSISAVAWYDAEGRLLLHQNIGDGIATLFTPTLDGLTIDVRQEKPRITMLLNATSPPSEIVMTVESDGSVIIDEAATFIELTPNDAYGGLAARRLLDDPPSHAGKSLLEMISEMGCEEIAATLLTAGNVACDFQTRVMTAIPLAASEAGCMSATAMVDLVRGIHSQNEDAMVQRALAGLKAGILSGCQLFQWAVSKAGKAGKANPWGIPCILLGLAEAGVTIYSGESLPQQICSTFTSDQPMGGVMTTNDLIYLVVFDTEDEDGDRIAIRHNGDEKFNGVVMHAPKTVAVHLVPGFNHFEFEALNEGTGPPNTARVVVRDDEGDDLNLTSYNLDMGQIATLDVIRK